MKPDPKRDAQKTEEAGRNAKPQANPAVAKPDAPGEEGIETAREKQKQNEQQKRIAPSPVRPRQDSLDLQRASGEGMIAPPSER